MKKAILLLSLCLSILIVSAQKTIVAPVYSASNVATLNIEKVVLSDTSTQVYFKSTSPADRWFRISDKSYLTAGDEKKYAAHSVSGITFNKEVYNKTGPTAFVINFEPVKAGAKTIDYLEGDCDRCFKILDIELTPGKKRVALPAAFYTNWFKTNGSKEWALAITNRKVIYDSKAWDYTALNTGTNAYKLRLTKGKSARELFVRLDSSGKITAWEDKKPRLMLANNVAGTKLALTNDKPFNQPIIKYDSAKFSGYINGYSPKLGFKTGMLHINNVVSGDQESHAFTIEADGSFNTSIYMPYPEECYLDMGEFYGTVFIGPGKKLFQYLDLSNNSERRFMGEYATLNNELMAAKPFDNLNYDKLYETAAQLSPTQFQEFIAQLKQQALAKTDQYRDENGMSAKGYQVIAMNVNYKVAEFILEYNSLRDRDYRKKTNAGPNQVESGYKPVRLNAQYLNVLGQYPLNDEASVLSSEYYHFVNRLRFNEIVSTINDLKTLNFYKGAFDVVPPVNDDEKEALKSLTEAISGPEVVAFYSIYKKHEAVFKEIGKGRESYFSSHASGNRESWGAMLRKVMTGNAGLTLDVVDAQDLASDMAHTKKPKNEAELAGLKAQLSTLTIYNAFADFNKSMTLKFAVKEQLKKGSAANKAPQTAADKLFSSILKKHAGKAVYIDFWATWCAPCRVGIEHIAPLKEELKNENIAFVYITDTSSPTDLYKKMIPDIKGDHHRLSQDDWNLIASQYGISAIPHYMLVNKKGVIINDQYSGAGNDGLKRELLKIAKE